MKRGTPQHPKLLALAARLKIAKYAAVGILESLWHFTAAYALPGNVGRFDNAVIAQAIGWEGDPTELISALVATGWLDEDAKWRLLIHDWDKHADDGLRKTLRNRGETFANGSPPYRESVATISRNGRETVAPLCAPEPEPEPQPQPQPQPQPCSAADAATPAKGQERPPKPDDPGFKKFTDYFVVRWQRKYGAKYVWKKDRDGPSAAGIWHASDDRLDIATQVIDRFFSKGDKFISDAKHPLSLLWSQINQFIGNERARGIPPDQIDEYAANVQGIDLKAEAEAYIAAHKHLHQSMQEQLRANPLKIREFRVWLWEKRVEVQHA